MGERKVLNKYIPADFDPRLVPRMKKSKNELVPVRMMLPFSIQCASCSSFLYRGRKFNSKKEPVQGDKGKYLGIQRFRFYIKCSVCSRPITFLTDPQNADYEMESGGTRNYEVHKDKERTEEEVAAEDAAEEKDDPMKALEKRVLASQREMKEMDALEEIRALNMKHRQLMGSGAKAAGASAAAGGGTTTAGGSGPDNIAAILDAREAAQHQEDGESLTETGLTESEEAMVQNIKFGRSADSSGALAAAASSSVTRLEEADEQMLEKKRRQEEARLMDQQRALEEKGKAAAAKARASMPVIKVKRKRKVPAETAGAEEENNKNDGGKKPSGGLGDLLGGYGSSSSSDSEGAE